MTERNFSNSSLYRFFYLFFLLQLCACSLVSNEKNLTSASAVNKNLCGIEMVKPSTDIQNKFQNAQNNGENLTAFIAKELKLYKAEVRTIAIRPDNSWKKRPPTFAIPVKKDLEALFTCNGKAKEYVLLITEINDLGKTLGFLEIAKSFDCKYKQGLIIYFNSQTPKAHKRIEEAFAKKTNIACSAEY